MATPPEPRKNVLFIMCDQLRLDYLSCYGHPKLHTPHIDDLAANGVRFTNAYVQSPICGPSRMSTYTGRYARSHGSTWNSFPLRVGEMGMGDHLRPLGVRTALCGKSHMTPDTAGMQRFGIDPDSDEGRLLQQCGFELWDRLDGLHPRKGKSPSHYNDYLRDQGFESDNPWEDWVNAPEGDHGESMSPWQMEHANRPAKIKEPFSETAYSTDRAMAFIEEAGDQPWCLHLSYIKPHWPLVAPAPYHNMYSSADILPVNRSAAEKANAHPLLAEFQASRVSRAYSRAEVRERAIPVYMGLIKQIDDHIGRLRRFLREKGRDKDTMIVFTSDHGDYLGDHWLGEKELFHDCSVRIPMIVCDPSPEAEATRGRATDALVESIDLLPTFVEYFGGEVPSHILEGHSLMGFLHGTQTRTRDVAISEYDYSVRQARVKLDVPIRDCRTQMVFDGRYKLVNVIGFRPMLYDLQEDPKELDDIAQEPHAQAEIARLMAHLHDWALRHHNRVTMSDADVASYMGSETRVGIYIGVWNEDDMKEIEKTGDGGY